MRSNILSVWDKEEDIRVPRGDYTVAECIDSGVSAFERSRQRVVRLAEKVAREEASWSDYHPSDSDEDEEPSSEEGSSGDVDENSSSSSDSPSKDSDKEPPRKRRRMYVAMRPPGRPKRPDELNGPPTNLPVA
ncbi:hypothetical protein PQX77_016068 [Marasmius sp. AFHP31]|nr:hypothetical protein PQX77_016068 [Marasmius sp. AFHP31]